MEEEDLKSGPFTWTREHLGNKGNSIYRSYILFQAAYATVFMYLEVSAEKRGLGTLWLQTAAMADKSCHSLSAYRAPVIVIDTL